MICCRLCTRRFRVTANERVLENHALTHRSNSNYCLERRMVWFRNRHETKCPKIIKLLRKRGPSFGYEVKKILNMILPERRIVGRNKQLMRCQQNSKPRFMMFYLHGQEKLAWKRIERQYNPQRQKKTFVLRTLGLNKREVLLVMEH